MAELPGWDRGRLDHALPADVEAARWIVFARKVQPVIAVDFPRRIRDIERIDRPASPMALRAERAREREELAQSQRLQSSYRAALGLDEPDE